MLRFLLPLVATAASLAAVEYQNPVRPGDYPDPSVIRVGDDYWAAATSSEWAPHFPILHSRDLVNWDVKGYVFASLPVWAKANFWAPEIAEDRGKFFVYYVARERASNHLAVAVATADNPAGPYTDHRPLVAQDAGSIDPVPFTDAQGRRWLVWKEDGNSRKQPTPLWIQRLSDDGLALVGERREILRNDAPWEGAVVEGPYVLRRGDTYYLFYSGNACCGRECNYALGVARAKDPLGPWEKCPANPILAGNDAWRCPGHGSLVTDADNRTWLLYHAYARKGFVATGRELMLDEVVFGDDGWPRVNAGRGPSTRAAAPRAARAQQDATRFREDFAQAGELAPGWQWPIGPRPAARVADGALVLTAGDEAATTVRSISVLTFVAETSVDVRGLPADGFAGLAIYGDRANEIDLMTDGRRVQVLSRKRQLRSTVAEVNVATSGAVALRLVGIDGNKFRFAVRAADGQWREVGDATDGSFLPPWDRGVRVGLSVAGPKSAQARFDYFALAPGEDLFAR